MVLDKHQIVVQPEGLVIRQNQTISKAKKVKIKESLDTQSNSDTIYTNNNIKNENKIQDDMDSKSTSNISLARDDSSKSLNVKRTQKRKTIRIVTSEELSIRKVEQSNIFDKMQMLKRLKYLEEMKSSHTNSYDDSSCFNESNEISLDAEDQNIDEIIEYSIIKSTNTVKYYQPKSFWFKVFEAWKLSMLIGIRDTIVSEVLPWLLVGNETIALSYSQLGRLDVTHVLNVTRHIPNKFQTQLAYLRLPLRDGIDNDVEKKLRDGANYIQRVKTLQGRVSLLLLIPVVIHMM